MERETIMRATIAGKRYCLTCEPHPSVAGVNVYRLYCERRLVSGGVWNTLEGALGHILTLVPGFSYSRFKYIWS